MLQFDQLSYWEKSYLLEDIDFLIVGAGIVGSACALRIRENHPSSKIVILERGYLPSGASTKNAGFACFGSVSEISDDLKNMPEKDVWDTVALRWRGLKRLEERFGMEKIGLRIRGSWDLTDELTDLKQLTDSIGYFNDEIGKITGESSCFSFDYQIAGQCGFRGISGGFYNRLEGELNTAMLFQQTSMLLAKEGIRVIHGVEVKSISESPGEAIVETTFGEIKTKKLAVTVNGFAEKLLNDQRIQPARAQVIVTNKLTGFDLPGTFHYQEGYYYFRAVESRLLIGGGRNTDKQGETTVEMNTSENIIGEITRLVNEKILPDHEWKIEYKWAGIMGVGDAKKPIVEMRSDKIGIAVRMGGMGVAIGSLAGEQLADLIMKH